MSALKPAPTSPTPSRPALPVWYWAVAAVAGGFLIFVLGVVVAQFKIFPYGLLFEDAFNYATASVERQQTEAATLAEAAAAPKTYTVTVKSAPEAFGGYVFLTMAASQPSTALLMDMDGKVVHRWSLQYRNIFPTPNRQDPSADNAIVWRYGHLFPNGDVLTVVKAHGDTPDGYGLVKVDKNSKLIWASEQNFHHQFSIAADGRIFATVHNWRDTVASPVPGVAELPKRVIEDFLVELSPDGKELSRVSLLELLAAGPYKELLGSAFAKGFNSNAWDPIHPNDIVILDAAFADKQPQFKAGHVLISMRDLDALAVVDLQQKKIVWATRGPWKRQHDPDLLPGGDVLLFDNRGDNVKGGGSRILQVNLATGAVNWSYEGTPDTPFFSETAGGQERLPNGNTQISEDDRGRLFEVTPAGKIVWEIRGARMHHAERFTREQLPFLNDETR